MPDLSSAEFSIGATTANTIETRAEKVKSTRPLEDADLSVFRIKDESIHKASGTLSPLGDTDSLYHGLIAHDFGYFEATNDIEIDSPRTKFLNEQVQKMIAGTEVQEARVVILNKGAIPQGFIYPEGTIFINQDLINTLDYVDEVVGVLAHEVNHRILRTHERDQKAGKLEKLGVGWIHEMAADLATAKLLEKCGYNSTAIGSAVEKLTGAARGTIHQSGNMREGYMMAYHHVIHSETSHLPLTPLEASWKTRENRPTNLEIAQEITARRDLQDRSVIVSEIFSKLHPKDLHEMYKSGLNMEDRVTMSEELERRLRATNYSATDKFLFRLAYGRPTGPFPGELISADQLVPFFTSLSTRESRDRYKSLHRDIFYQNRPFATNDVFLEYLSKNMYVETPENKDSMSGIAVNESAIIELCEVVQGEKKTTNIAHQDTLGTVVVSYINEAFVRPARAENRDIDDQAVKNFVEKISEYITFSPLAYQNVGGFHKEFKEAGDYLYSLFEEKDPEKNIDQKINVLISSFHQEITSPFANDKKTPEALREIQKHVLELPESEVENVMERIFSKIDELPAFTHGIKLRELLNGNINSTNGYGLFNQYNDSRDTLSLTPEDQALNQRIRSCNLKLITLLSISRTDDELFYIRANKIMEESGLTDILSPTELLNLSSPILHELSDTRLTPLTQFSHQWHVILNTQIPARRPTSYIYLYTAPHDMARIFELPFIKASIKSGNVPENISMTELYNHAKKFEGQIGDFYVDELKKGIFKDSPLSILYFGQFRERFTSLIEQDLGDNDKKAFYDFVKEFLPDDPTKSKILKKLGVETLQSELTFDQKVDFLKDNLNTIGPEGLFLLGNQITTMQMYRHFREVMGERLEQELEGSLKATTIAAGDVATSFLTRNFDELLKTAIRDSDSSKEISTSVAFKWFEEFVTGHRASITGVKEYLQDSNTFVLDNKGRYTFRSISDMFETLHNTSYSQRVAILMKAFLDQDGAFSSPENKAELAEFAIKALGIEKGFVADLVTALCKNGNVNTIALPLASAVSGHLFEGLQTSAVDLAEIDNNSAGTPGWYQKKKLAEIPRQNLEELLTRPTRELTTFGQHYHHYANPEGVERIKDVSDLYYQTYDRLRALAEGKDIIEIEKRKNGAHEIKDPTIQAILKAIQGSGALGVRATQLSMSFDLGLSEDIREQLSETFDSNPGLQKLFLWENLYNIQERAKTGNGTYREVAAFINDVEVHEKLGGGSLYTTFAAELRRNGLPPREIVLKSLNPNAEMMIDSYHQLINNAIRTVSDQSPEYAHTARTLQTLIDFSKEWCLADIRDPYFERDDDAFRGHIAAFNRNEGRDVLSAPDRVLTHFLVKAEDRAQGRTLNAVLKDPTISFEQKRDAAYTVLDFFATQLEQRPVKLRDDDGKKREYYLMLSDPNPGNTIVDLSGEEMNCSVIDRSMYLKLTRRQMESVRSLYHGEYNTFAREFFFAVCEANGVGLTQQLSLGKEVKKAMEESIGNVDLTSGDPMELLQIATKLFLDRDMTIPLEYQLALKNVFVLKPLQEKLTYSVEELTEAMDAVA